GNACLRWLNRDVPDLDAARDAVARIVRDAHRAGEVIQGVRALTKKSGNTGKSVGGTAGQAGLDRALT
ncbi:MAG TPA: hypothetical protein VGH41_16210, partial [Paraburkholderia sp.]